MCKLAVFDFSLPVQLMNTAVKHSECLIICILYFMFCIYVYTSYNSQATERFFLKCLAAAMIFTALVSSSRVAVTPTHPPFPLSSCLSSPPTGPLARRQVGHLVMVVVVRADLLHQAVVRTVEGNIDTDDLERLGANPGHVALDLLLETGLGWVIVAQRGAFLAIHLLIVYAAVEDLGVLGVDHTLALQVKLYCLDRWYQAD